MRIKGERLLSTDIPSLWPMLQDEEVLARISPGVSNVEKLSDGNYKAISEISIGPVRGKFEGNIVLQNILPHESMTLVLNQNSKMGNAEARVVMNLTEQSDQQTLLTYDGAAKLSGRLATMGQRILGGVVGTLTKQVFKELETVIVEKRISASGTSDTQPDSDQQRTGEHKENLIQSIINKVKDIWKSIFR